MSQRERKRAVPNLEEASLTTASSSSALRAPYAARRSPSPPASAYFPLLSARDALRPTADADSHFAYSTTLRRHHVDNPLGSPADIAQTLNAEASSLWGRAVAAVTGQQQPERSQDNLESARLLAQPNPAADDDRRDTVSARFAHTSAEDTVSYYRSDANAGLLKSDISGLLEKHGYNEFSVSSPEPLFLKFAKTIYESPLILLLCGSATISAVMGNLDDAISIAVAVLIVLTVGFVQEHRSEKSLEALNKLVPHHCHVIRQGSTIHVLANELVPGDIVTFSTGDRIPADIRLIEAVELDIDESSLTGETDARRKTPETCVHEQVVGGGQQPVALAERSCIAYMGTLVRNGRGRGIVIATGSETEFGVIFSMMQDVEERRTPLQLSMDELAKNLSIASFGVIGIICLIGLIQKRKWLDMFTIGVSLAVAAIPEGLPIVTTVTLALGVLRMSKRKAIVKKLHSVEALGSVSVICSDKTGTLTRNEQTVVDVYVVDESVGIDTSTNQPLFPSSSNKHSETGGLSPAMLKALQIGSLCNNASLRRNDEGIFVGQGTDVALLNVLDVFGIPDGRSVSFYTVISKDFLTPSQTFRRTGEKPFSSENKYMAVSGIHTASDGAPTAYTKDPSREFYYTKGSLDTILPQCRFYYMSDDSTPALDASTRGVVMSRATEASRKGLRVVGVAYGYGPVDGASNLSMAGSRAASPAPGETKQNLVFVGFTAMLDPPRKGVADSISLLQSGGVRVVMITGDAEETAVSIARSLGLKVGAAPTRYNHQNGRVAATSSIGGRDELPGGDGGSFCLTGKAIDQMSKAQLKERVGTVSVFARTTPRHKMAIVGALQARGEVVAMTGDGGAYILLEFNVFLSAFDS